jgi:hypothetical protein
VASQIPLRMPKTQEALPRFVHLLSPFRSKPNEIECYGKLAGVPATRVDFCRGSCESVYKTKGIQSQGQMGFRDVGSIKLPWIRF